MQLQIGLEGLALLRGWPFSSCASQWDVVRRIAALSAGYGEVTKRVTEVGVDDAYARWARVYATRPNPLIECEERALRAALSHLEPGLSLDVAAGTGRVGSYLRSLGHEVVSADATAQMLTAGNDGLAERPAAVVSDLHELPFPPARFDNVVCALALAHLDEIGAAIAEVSRVLRRGGRLVLTDVHPAAASLGVHGLFQTDGGWFVARNHVHWHSAYLAAFRSAGLVVEDCAEPLMGRRWSELAPAMAGASAEAREAFVTLPGALVWVVTRQQAT